MSWSQFARLISENDRNLDAWKAAIDGNPNEPAHALRVAMMHFISCKDTTAIHDLCSFVVSLVNGRFESSVLVTEYENALAMIGVRRNPDYEIEGDATSPWTYETNAGPMPAYTVFEAIEKAMALEKDE